MSELYVRVNAIKVVKESLFHQHERLSGHHPRTSSKVGWWVKSRECPFLNLLQWPDWQPWPIQGSPLPFQKYNLDKWCTGTSPKGQQCYEQQDSFYQIVFSSSSRRRRATSMANSVRIFVKVRPHQMTPVSVNNTTEETKSDRSPEFLTDDVEWPTKGERRDARCLDRLYVGELMKETLGHNGLPLLWIFGKPYKCGMRPAGLLKRSYSRLGSSPFLCKDNRIDFILRSRVVSGFPCGSGDLRLVQGRVLDLCQWHDR